jgi:hypothetical protein
MIHWMGERTKYWIDVNSQDMAIFCLFYNALLLILQPDSLDACNIRNQS